MPLATELLPLLTARLEHKEMQAWLEWLQARLAWLGAGGAPAALNIEEVFHLANFDVESFRLQQHLCKVGRLYGTTPWDTAEKISSWLDFLEDALCDVILETDEAADLASIVRWANHVSDDDTVLTFNYDTLAERALHKCGRNWHHATGVESSGIPVCKLHGSIDWMVAPRCDQLDAFDLLYDKPNENGSGEKTGDREDDFRLWRCTTREQLRSWIDGRDLQRPLADSGLRTVGIAGLGAYKPLHEVPGLGAVWATGMGALYKADHAIVAGFSMSDFDAIARMQFSEIAMRRRQDGKPLPVTVIDPFLDARGEDRFRSVFRYVDFVKQPHQAFDWRQIAS